MAVELAGLVGAVQAASSPPGENLYPNATADHWVMVLSNAFWEAFLEGWFAGYRVTEDAQIVATTASEDLPRDQQQVIVLFAALSAVRAKLLGLPTARRYKAGPVEAETDFAPSVLVALLKSLEDQLKRVVESFGASAPGSQAVRYFDNVLARNAEVIGAYDYWVR